MGLIAGLGRTYAAQRQNSAMVDAEETRIRQLAALRAGDSDYNYNKQMDRSAQEANARVTPMPGLPDPLDIPTVAAPERPPQAAAEAFPNAWATKTASGGKPREKVSAGPDQSAAESARLARQRPYSSGAAGTTTAPRTMAEAALQASGKAGGRPMYIENTRGVPPARVPVAAAPSERNIDTNMAAFNELQTLNQGRTPVATPQAAYDERLRNVGAPDPRAARWDSVRTPYDAQIEAAARQAGVDPVVFRRLIGSESSFNPAATNGVAHGIAQVYKTNIGAGPGQLSMQDALNPERALPWAAQHLRQKIDAAGGDVNAGVLAYKGATSEAGRASMMPVVQAILSGTRYGQSTPAAPSTAPPATATASGGMGATAAAAQPAAPTPLTPEQYVRVAQAATSDLQYYELEAQRLAEVLKFTRDAATQRTLQTQLAQLQSGRQELQFVRAMASGAAGDFRALSQLAQLAGVSFRPVGPQQIQLVRPDGAGNYVPGATVSTAIFAQQLYQTVSPSARAAAAKQRDKTAEIDAQGRNALALEGLKGANELGKIGVQGEQKIREIMAQNGLDANSFGRFEPDANGRDGAGTLFLKGGGVLRLSPGQDLGNGMRSVPTLSSVAMQ